MDVDSAESSGQYIGADGSPLWGHLARNGGFTFSTPFSPGNLSQDRGSALPHVQGVPGGGEPSKPRPSQRVPTQPLDFLSTPPPLEQPQSNAPALASGKKPVWHLAKAAMDLCDRGFFTPTPPSGFPTVHKNDPEALLFGLTDERKKMIKDARPDSIVIAEVYGIDSSKMSQLKTTTDNLTAAIREATGETSFIVVPPEAVWGISSSGGHPPTAWIILRLSPRAVTSLTKKHVWSAELITFLAYEKNQVFPCYLLTIGSFIQNIEHDIESSIEEAFRSPAIFPSIRSLAKNNPGVDDTFADEITRKTLDSLKVEVIQTPNGNLVAKIYCDTPTIYPDLWRRWTAYLRSLSFKSKYNLTAVACSSVRCSGCHADDHPVVNCPMTLVPGWNGPRTNNALVQRPPTAPRATLSARPTPENPRTYPPPAAPRSQVARGRRGAGYRLSRNKPWMA